MPFLLSLSYAISNINWLGATVYISNSSDPEDLVNKNRCANSEKDYLSNIGNINWPLDDTLIYGDPLSLTSPQPAADRSGLV